MAQRMVHQHAGQHGFSYRRRPDTHAGVVAAVRLDHADDDVHALAPGLVGLVDDRLALTGITDFGDMTHTALVCDLAVAAALTCGGALAASGRLALGNGDRS